MIARQLAKALNVNGPFNIQLIAKDNELKVTEFAGSSHRWRGGEFCVY